MYLDSNQEDEEEVLQLGGVHTIARSEGNLLLMDVYCQIQVDPEL